MALQYLFVASLSLSLRFSTTASGTLLNAPDAGHRVRPAAALRPGSPLPDRLDFHGKYASHAHGDDMWRDFQAGAGHGAQRPVAPLEGLH